MRFLFLFILLIQNTYAHRVTLGFEGINYEATGDQKSLTVSNNLDSVSLVQVFSNINGLVSTVKLNRKKEKKILLRKTKGEKLYIMGINPPTKKIEIK